MDTGDAKMFERDFAEFVERGLNDSFICHRKVISFLIPYQIQRRPNLESLKSHAMAGPTSHIYLVANTSRC